LYIVDVGDGRLWKSSRAPVETNVSRQTLQVETTGERDNQKRERTRGSRTLSVWTTTAGRRLSTRTHHTSPRRGTASPLVVTILIRHPTSLGSRARPLRPPQRPSHGSPSIAGFAREPALCGEAGPEGRSETCRDALPPYPQRPPDLQAARHLFSCIHCSTGGNTLVFRYFHRPGAPRPWSR